MTTNTNILASDSVIDYLTAGRATVTILNVETLGRHTYRITAPGKTAKERRAAEICFVSVLTGPENTSDYTYIGILIRRTGEFKLTAKSRFQMSDKRVAGFSWLCRHASRKSLYRFRHVEVRHHNHCGACNRLLTVPESVDTGLGPICAKALKVKWVRNDERTVAA